MLSQTKTQKRLKDHKRFKNDLFRPEVDYDLSKLDVSNLEFEPFLSTFIEVLNKHAPMKKKKLYQNSLRKNLIKSHMINKEVTVRISYIGPKRNILLTLTSTL